MLLLLLDHELCQLQEFGDLRSCWCEHRSLSWLLARVRGVLSKGQEACAGMRTASERESSGCCSSRAYIRDITGQPAGASRRAGEERAPGNHACASEGKRAQI